MKWKLLGAFAVFTLVMLALLWTFQVVLLDQFYKGIKTRDINSAAQTLSVLEELGLSDVLPPATDN